MKKTKLMLGDNIESLKKLPDNSVDSVVTDPPYGLSFMNKKWDYDVPSVEFWTEVYRVLKPGGHVLSFGGTRTYHRMVVNIEDAGFEIRDQIQWIYGSGFPKSHNIGKAVDKLEGNDRQELEPTGRYKYGFDNSLNGDIYGNYGNDIKLTKGTSPYEGWGTALKPANEPICVARKPLSEKSVAENVLKWGTGGINIDGCRVGSESIPSKGHKGDTWNKNYENLKWEYNEGRFPANIILECICDEVIKGEKGEVKKSFPGGTTFGGDNKMKENVVGTWFNDKGDTHTDPNCPCRLLDEQSGVLKSSYATDKSTGGWSQGLVMNKVKQTKSYKGLDGGASRFFYQAKVSKAERNMGLDGFEDKEKIGNLSDVVSDSKLVVKNNHPTVKPINLMSYLCRLITPEGGIVLDPFMGSGSTGVAAQLEGFRFVGMEMDKDYFNIAEARISSYEKYEKFKK